MNEKTTFYPPESKVHQSPIAFFNEKIRNFSLDLQLKTTAFNLEELYDFLWIHWAKPDFKFLQPLIKITYQKVDAARFNQCPLQELIELLSSLVTLTDFYVQEEKKKNNIYISNHRQSICKPLQDSIASVILENQPSEVKEYFQSVSFKEQQKILQNISCSSNSSETLFLQFCSEIFSNVDLIIELLYKNHYSENSEE